MEKANDDTNQLWVHLSGFAGGNIFAIYPKILEEIFKQKDACRDEELRHENESIVLPSDMEWRLKVYFQLVEKQRQMDDLSVESPAIEKLKAVRCWSRPDSACDPWTTLGNLATSAVARRTARTLYPRKSIRLRDPPWGPKDLAKAARLLEKPPLPVAFEDDQEMRRVYSLIYDVFRYKCVLEEALLDTGFYETFSQAENRKGLAWLLLFDQQRRRWTERDLTNEPPSNSNLKERRSRNRRKLSKDSLRTSRDSSTDWLSRDSSLDTKDGRISRSSLLRTKVRAVKELSTETKEALRQAREAAGLKTPNSDSELEALAHLDSKPKIHMIPELPVSTSECDKSDVDSIREEIDQDSKKDEIKSERKSSGGSSTSTRFMMQDSADELDYNISRNEMRNVMETVAGDIGPCVKNFDVELWEHRVKIAAAIAKIRIRNKALTLSELLPPHLRDERVSASSQRDVITGWVNVFKSRSISDLVQRLNEMGYSYSTSRSLEPNQFRFDRYCPKFMFLRPAVRSEFAKSPLLLENIIILQEREFCLGAAALCRALKDAQLHGDVVQTHGTSPKAAAYLAAQLRDWPAYQGQLIVFGTGERKSEYEGFLKSLGATNTKIIAEDASEAGHSYWAGAVAALAAPPNSYSAVMDPIDLVCSRGGDLRMLEMLTDSEVNTAGRNRVLQILEEQKKTLRLCMSKPQIQMIVYETHSALSAENGDMVKKAVAETNRAARELHMQAYRQRVKELNPKMPKCAMISQKMDLEVESDAEVIEEVPNTAKSDKTKTDTTEMEENKSPKSPTLDVTVEILPAGNELIEKSLSVDTIPEETPEKSQSTLQPTASADQLTPTSPAPSTNTETDSEVKVPDCDLFEEEYPYTLMGMSSQEREGCFLALIKRKELIRMNAKYMINVAESRGLFGGNAPPPRRPPPTRKKVQDVQKYRNTKKKLSKSEMERIAAPTHAWSVRVSACVICTADAELQRVPCAACVRRHAAFAVPRARFWWRLAIRHVVSGGQSVCGSPLRLPRGGRSSRPQLALAVTKPRFDLEPSPPHYGCTVYSKLLEAIEDI